MYSNEYLKELMESYTKPTVFPLDEDDEDKDDKNKAVFTKPTFIKPVLSTENNTTIFNISRYKFIAIRWFKSIVIPFSQSFIWNIINVFTQFC